MPKEKKGTALAPASLGPPMGAPDFTNIIKADIPISQKRGMILSELGLKQTRKKYASKEERKLAAKERAKKRKEERLAVLKKYKLEPKKKGPKLSKEQRKQRRKARTRVKKEFLRDMVQQNPELASKYGIDPSRFKL